MQRTGGGRHPEPLRPLIRDRLRRRLSAPRRIGCPYRLAALNAAAGFDAAWWLAEANPRDGGRVGRS